MHVILFSYQCSFTLECFAFQLVCLSVLCISNSFILSCVENFVNNFFQLFSIHFCSFEEGIENLSFYVVSCCLLLSCSATLDTIHLLIDKSQQNFFQKFPKWHFNQFQQFVSLFLYMLHIFIILSRIPLHCYNSRHHKSHLWTPWSPLQ